MAYTLNGTTQYLTASGSAYSQDVGTIAVWARPAYTPAGAADYTIWDKSSAQYMLATDAANKADVHFDGREANEFNTTGLWSAGDWVHFAVVYNKTGNVIRLFVNGAELTAGSTAGTWGSNSVSGTTLTLGSRGDGSKPFPGDVGEFATWTVPLDTAEIAALAKGFSPALIRPTSLNAYLKLFGNASPELDSWKNNYSATLVGSPTKAVHPRIYYPTQAKIGKGPDGAANFQADVVGAGTTSASLSVGATFSAAVTGAGGTAASLSTGAGFTAVVTGAGTTSATFAELVPVGVVTARIGIALWRTRVGSLTIRDLLNAAPNTCSFKVEGSAPTVGQAVEIRIGNGTITTELLFAGSIMSVAESYEGRPENLVWQVTCQDHTRTINRRKVRKRYAQQSATAIALDVIVTYTTGFTTDGIVAGLPTVTGGIDFTEEDVLNCLTRLASRIGGYSDVDYEKDVRLFLTEASDAPDPLQAGYPFLHEPAITPDSDLSQIRTRVYVEGGGSQARNAVAVGATSIPVTDATWYDGAGGIVVSGPQRITYTGKGEAGGPSAPTGAQSLVVGNLGGGPYTYKVSQIDSGVESPLSAASAAVSIDPVPDSGTGVTAVDGAFNPPGSAPTIGTLTAGTGPDTGVHEYAVTFVTATGETPPGPRSAQVTTGPVTAPASAPSVARVAGGSLSDGAYKWKVVYENAAGATTPGPESASLTMETEASAPTAIGTMVLHADIGTPVSARAYKYKYLFRKTSDSAFMTLPSPASNTVTANTDDWAIRMAQSGAQSPPSGYERAFYRTVANGSVYKEMTGGDDGFVFTTGGDYYDNATQTDGDLDSDAPTESSAGYHKADLTSIPVSADPSVTQKGLYRTLANGSTFKRVATLSAAATTYTDNTPDASLGADAPSSNTAARNVVPLTAIATGPGGTTARKLYRTTAAAPTGTLKLVATISGNVTTTYTDSTADGSLGANAPTTNTAGGSLGTGTYGWKVTFITATGESAGGTAGSASITTGSANLTNVPVSADVRVTQRKVYRTTVGGSTYLYEGTISNNTTTTFTSSIADGALGSALSGVNTTAAGKMNLTGIATGGGGVSARKLYRTVSGGATYKLVTTINDNATTTYLDNIADASLGGVASGDIITALTGIPSSGAGSVLYEIPISSDVNILEQCDDVAAQTALAAMEGGDSDGIYEHFIQDRRLASAEARATGNADLALFAYPIVTIRYATRDPKTRSGKTIHVDLPALNILGDFTIQSVVIDQIGTAQNTWPRYTVEASSVRFSLEDVLRRLQLAA